MTIERVEKAIEVINYAINNNISVKEASVKCGYADTYVKNVKAIIYGKYENNTLEDELFNKFNEAYTRYINPMNEESIINEKPKNIPTANNGEQTTFNVDGNSATIEWKAGSNYPVDHIKTLDELLKVTKVDLNTWKVKNYLVNKWDVTSWKNNNPETIQNFQVKANLERDIKTVKEIQVGEIFIDMVKNYTPPVFKINVNENKILNVKENNLLEISIFDLHIGKLCWEKETGENYDVKIACKRFTSIIETILNRAKGFDYNRILFPVGNDFFNSDTMLNTTTAGTPVDEDLRWKKTYNIGTKLLVDAINILKQTGVPIDVLIISGNHDYEKSHYMGSFLEAWFRNDDNVNINNGETQRKYYKFGDILLGFTHGNEEKESSLPMLMANDFESKPLWSETKYHEWHLGHIHRKRNVNFTVIDKTRPLSEDLGVIIRYLSSLSGTDFWHYKKGFVGAIKAADAFIWNDKAGLLAHLNANLTIE